MARFRSRLCVHIIFTDVCEIFADEVGFGNLGSCANNFIFFLFSVK